MKYFTQELLDQYQNEETCEQSHVQWEKNSKEYNRYLYSIYRDLTPDIMYMAMVLCLHDAKILYIIQNGKHQYIVTVKLESPFNDIVNLKFTLLGDVITNKNLRSEDWWAYEELEKVNKGSYIYSILLSSGTEITIPFSDVEVTVTQPQPFGDLEKL
jgi:hypothetical protein